MTPQKYELYLTAQLSTSGKGSSSAVRPFSQVKLFNKQLKWIIFIHSDISSFTWSLADEAILWYFISLCIFLFLLGTTYKMFILSEVFIIDDLPFTVVCEVFCLLYNEKALFMSLGVAIIPIDLSKYFFLSYFFVIQNKLLWVCLLLLFLRLGKLIS